MAHVAEWKRLKVDELVRFHTDVPGSPTLYATTFILAMNRERYESLPGELRQAIDANADQAFAAEAGRMWDTAGIEVIKAVKKRGNVIVQRFKGLGEMNPMQLRETTMNPDTRKLVQLTLDSPKKTEETLDMLLAKKRASDRRSWLESKGDQASIA